MADTTVTLRRMLRRRSFSSTGRRERCAEVSHHTEVGRHSPNVGHLRLSRGQPDGRAVDVYLVPAIPLLRRQAELRNYESRCQHCERLHHSGVAAATSNYSVVADECGCSEGMSSVLMPLVPRTPGSGPVSRGRSTRQQARASRRRSFRRSSSRGQWLKPRHPPRLRLPLLAFRSKESALVHNGRPRRATFESPQQTSRRAFVSPGRRWGDAFAIAATSKQSHKEETVHRKLAISFDESLSSEVRPGAHPAVRDPPHPRRKRIRI